MNYIVINYRVIPRLQQCFPIQDPSVKEINVLAFLISVPSFAETMKEKEFRFSN
jgi:hypothetical protein